MKNFIWVVWLQYPGEPARFSAAFQSKEEAEKYAQIDPDAPPIYKTWVNKEPLFKTADEV